MGEVRETASAFAPVAFDGPGRFRHFGSEGPLYEVLGVSGDEAHIRVVESGEELDYPIAAAAQDPLA